MGEYKHFNPGEEAYYRDIDKDYRVKIIRTREGYARKYYVEFMYEKPERIVNDHPDAKYIIESTALYPIEDYNIGEILNDLDKLKDKIK